MLEWFFFPPGWSLGGNGVRRLTKLNWGLNRNSLGSKQKWKRGQSYSQENINYKEPWFWNACKIISNFDVEKRHVHVPACDREGGGTVLARGAQPCVLLCGLPDSRHGCRWHRVSAVCSAGALTQTVGHTDTVTHTHTHKKANEYRWSSSFLGINLLFKDQSCKLKYYSVTFAYSVSIFKNPHVVSDNMHWQVSLPQGCSQGRTTGMSAWLGANTWGPAMVNKISE